MSVKTGKKKWLFSLSFGFAVPDHFSFLVSFPSLCAAENFLFRV